jgi:hypothetical protein
MGRGEGIPINGGDVMAIKTKAKKTKGDKMVVEADSDSETEVGACLWALGTECVPEIA